MKRYSTFVCYCIFGFIFIIAVGSFYSCTRQEAPADLVLLNGNIYTVNPGKPENSCYHRK